jgi:hypothetical protein
MHKFVCRTNANKLNPSGERWMVGTIQGIFMYHSGSSTFTAFDTFRRISKVRGIRKKRSLFRSLQTFEETMNDGDIVTELL